MITSPPVQRARAAVVAALVLPAMALTACGAENPSEATATPSVDLPTGDVEVPEGVTLTEPGTELAFGETATVAYEPNTQRSSVIELTVTSVRTGKIADLAGYDLQPRARASRPYYVRARVSNVGDGDLSRAAVPLYAVDSRNALILPSSFNNTFERCPSTPIPAGFTEGESMTGCLVYLVPEGGTLEAMSYRPLQAFEPVTWTGTIAPVEKAEKKSKKGKKGKKADSKKGQS